ncbi:MAG: transposase [Roseovarius sp.]
MFFTVRLADPSSDLLTRHVDLLRAAVRRTQADHLFDIDAWVTLPDHLHCIWKLPPGDSDHAARWAVIMARFTRALGQDPKHAKPIWHPHIWQHAIRGPQEHKHLTRYCWMNPVKHGLVPQPGDWLYSSWHRDRLDVIAEECGVAVKPGAGASQARDLVVA